MESQGHECPSEQPHSGLGPQLVGRHFSRWPDVIQNSEIGHPSCQIIDSIPTVEVPILSHSILPSF